jgi:hypothetical protein
MSKFIKCEKVGDDFKESKYKIGSNRTKPLSYVQALGKLEEAGDNVDTAQAKLKSAYMEAKRKNKSISETGPKVITTPNKQSLWIFSDLRFAIKEDTTMFYIRTRKDAQEYVETKDPLAMAMQIRVSYKTKDGMKHSTLYAKIQERYEQVISAKLLFNAKITNGEDEEGSQVYSTMSVSQYWDAIMKDHFCKCEEYMIDIPTTITLDKDVPTFFYFNPDELDDSIEPNTWLNWERNLIPRPFREAFRALLYAPLDPDNNGRQALWMYDGGHSGKSSVLNAIGKFYGRAHAAASKSSFDNQFSYAKFFGKRVITYGDNKNPTLHKTEVFHSILGSDSVDIERKYRDSFCGEMRGKVFVASNCSPKLDLSQANENTRLVPIPLLSPSDEYLKSFCEVDAEGNLVRDPVTGEVSRIGSNTFGTELEQQFGAYLKMYCKKAYDKLCKTGSSVYLNSECKQIIRDECGSESHQAQEDFVRDNIKIYSSEDVVPRDAVTLPLLELKDRYRDHLTERRIRETDFSFGEFTRFLKENYHISMKRIQWRTPEGARASEQVFVGACWKEDYPRLVKDYEKAMPIASPEKLQRITELKQKKQARGQ